MYCVVLFTRELVGVVLRYSHVHWLVLSDPDVITNKNAVYVHHYHSSVARVYIVNSTLVQYI